MNKEEFLLIANKKHGEKYDYSLVELTTTKQSVTIVCPGHGKFIQNVANHIYTGKGCRKCYIANKRTSLESFIKKANIAHNFKYDYSLIKQMPYHHSIKINIICPRHGIFEQNYPYHLVGTGCLKCGLVSAKSKTTTQQKDFILQCIKIHGEKYDYSLVDYVNSKTKIKIICNIHHQVFEQIPSSHLRGSGCNICSKNKKLDTEMFIKKCELVHNSKYDYSLVNYISAHTKIFIICHTHGIFTQTANSHVRGSACPKCRSSKAEILISNFLISNNIYFIPQYKIAECKYIRELPFDFYLPNINTLIEYQGEQHYNPLRFLSKRQGKRKLKDTKRNDKIKKKYCIDNNIKLLEITWKDNIISKLNSLLSYIPVK